jgi:hypothetical protein
MRSNRDAPLSARPEQVQQTEQALLDHLVGGHEQRLRYRQTKRFDRFEVNYQFKLCRCLHRKIGRLFTAQDAIDVRRVAASDRKDSTPQLRPEITALREVNSANGSSGSMCVVGEMIRKWAITVSHNARRK